MVEIVDTLWWGVIALAFVVLVVAAGMRGGGGEPAPVAADADAYEPEPMTLGDWRNEHEGRQAPRGGGWVECFCCGCPALDEDDFPTCEVCGWDGDVEGIDAARTNFHDHGSLHAPEEGAAAVSAQERTLALELAAACAALPEGQAPPPEFWPAFYERLDALERTRAAPRGVAG